MYSAPWQNPRILITLACVFLSGAAAGAITMRLGFPAERHRTGPVYRDDARDFALQRFKNELHLSPEQTKQMETVLDDFWTYYQYLQAQMQDVRATGKNRIIQILSDDQKQKFNKMMSAGAYPKDRGEVLKAIPKPEAAKPAK